VRVFRAERPGVDALRCRGESGGEGGAGRLAVEAAEEEKGARDGGSAE
jgi:hypothetical protein